MSPPPAARDSRPLPPRQRIVPAPVSAPIPVSISREDSTLEVPGQEASGKQEPAAKKDKPSQPTLNKRSSMESGGGGGRPVVARQRSSIILESAFSPKVAKGNEPLSSLDVSRPKIPANTDPSMVCTVAYRGMEVLFGTARNPDPVVYCLCARTRVVLQTLDLPSSKDASIVSLLSNPANGMVMVAMSSGKIQTYHPVPTVSKFSADPTQVVSAFGKFRWINGPVIFSREIFYGTSSQDENVFCHESVTDGPGEAVSVSSSADFKVLVSHRDQLAVFDVSPIDTNDDDDEVKVNDDESPPRAELLWTARLERSIETSRLSGDGRAIALVVEGEGLENDNPFGIRTFIRDSEDGSTLRSEILEPKQSTEVDIPRPGPLNRSISSSKSIGIVFKPGPFLVHTSSVSTISFRGFGHNNSDVYPEETEGNDLLLTHCRNGNSIRIFSQNSWKVLTEWVAPPNTRADWVRGLSAFNLGDLEASKRRKKVGSAPPSRRPSMNSLTDASGGINADLLGNRPPTYQGPNTAAGAWIVEVTFRNNFPALRLSRLSYMKRGGDEMQPAHFESVAAILPSSSLNTDSVLSMGDCGLSVQGVWPAWNPWRSDASNEESEGTLSGSAMAFLGLSSTSPSPAGFFGENYQAGTHSPPSELRVVASHPATGKVVLMEFPLWGDDEFGAMELGSPLRYELALAEVGGTERLPATIKSRDEVGKHSNDEPRSICVSLVYESSVICGQISANGKSLSLTWRKEGSMSVLPSSVDSERRDSIVSVASSCSLDSSCSPSVCEPHPDSGELEDYKDVSVIPAPLSLPTLTLPKNELLNDDTVLVAAKWWSDVAYSGLPQLLTVTSEGDILVYELSPPWSALEPTMPSDDLFVASSAASFVSGGGEIVVSGDDSDDESTVNGDYEVMLTPDPDFGIGLRLEAQIDGMPAIAGSFKKHPLNRGILPAESTGMIVLGDELVSINGISLEGISFDDIITTVRQVGTNATAGTPICMKFRPAMDNRRRISTANSAFSASETMYSESSRRSMEQILGVNLNQKKLKAARKGDEGMPRATSFSSVSKATTEIGTGDFDLEKESETANDFSRVVAFVPKALPCVDAEDRKHFQSCLALLPWHDSGIDEPSSEDRRLALLIIAQGTILYASRLEFTLDDDLHNATCEDIGSFDFSSATEANAGKTIRMIERVPTSTDSWCIAVRHNDGTVRITFIEESEAASDESPSSRCDVKFRTFPIFQMEASGPSTSNFAIRASSIELFATLSAAKDGASTVSVWSSRPSPASVEEGHGSEEMTPEESLDEYVESSILSGDDEVVDIRFIPGCLDAFPHLVTMTRSAATVHRRDGGSLEWKPVVRLKYPSSPHSKCVDVTFESLDKHGEASREILSPVHAIPHLVPTLRSLVSVCDGKHYLRSDWHPDAILAYACSAAQGAKTSLQHNIKGIYIWLSRWLDADENERPMLDSKYPLVVAPLRDFDGHDLLMPPDDNTKDDVSNGGASDQAWSLIRSTADVTHPKSKEDKLLEELQHALYASQREKMSTSDENTNDTKYSLPEPLDRLSTDEIRLLWAIGEMLRDPPKFKSLDPEGQLTLFSVSLLRSLGRATNGKDNEVDWGRTTMVPRSFLIKQPSSTFKTDKKEFVPIASAGCLSAMTSSCQGRILEACRMPNEKFDWDIVRTIRLPFWLRSDTQLLAVCEEVGQRTFKDTRNVLDCALFFVATGNMRRLRGFAATDQSISGRTFSKFITEQDFSSPRGRKAAEKNAYSLLRKKQYQRGAAFFLLAKPPMLKTALEVIVNQMDDLDLAFLVARVMGSGSRHPDSEIGGFGGGGIGSPGLMLGGMMGAGGGYASGGAEPEFSSVDDTSYDDWEPQLSTGAKNLLKERGLDMASHDPCLKALQLIWLGRREEASVCLSGLSQESEEGRLVLESDALFPRSFDLRLGSKLAQSNGARNVTSPLSTRNSSSVSDNDRVLKKANSVINFVSCPFLVKSMHVSVRSRWASTLLVSRALTRRGIDLVSTRILLQNTDENDLNENGANKTKKVDVSGSTGSKAKADLSDQAITNGVPSSSIFDTFNGPPTTKVPQAAAPSSIFDSFDAPPQVRKQKATVVSDPMPSSIFDGYNAPPPKRQPVQPVPEAQPPPSILDSFDTVPQQKKKPTVVCDPMTSSIFDSFDTGPPKKKLVAHATQTSSSIFDSFDAPPSAKVKSAPSLKANQSGEMASSIFDSFETPGSTRTPSTTLHSPSNTSQQVSTSHVNTASPEDSTGDDDISDVVSLSTPKVWIEWRRHMLVQSAARRLLREIATIMSRFHSDALDTPMKLFRRHLHPLVPFGAGEVLHQHCESDFLIASMNQCLEDICAPSSMDKRVVVDQAIRILSCPSRQNRVVYAALLHSLVGRTDRAEEVVRDASIGQIQHCEAVACSNDHLVENRKTSHHMASQYLRRFSARVSWQLEICLWMNRGGILPLSAYTIKEATIAVRTGLVVASWGRCHTCLESMIRYEPDSPMDEEAGAQLWSSMKLIVGPEDRRTTTATGGGSGGWEFLVDCRRSEATEMLRNKPPGTFIIRPHPEDTGVFTLSFKTNLVPTEEYQDDEGGEDDKMDTSREESIEQPPTDSAPTKSTNTKPVKKDDVVQHAIIRLSDAGFRCGSFGPFATLLQLLEGVSGSLPFDLLFHKPPSQGIIKDEGTQPSPNAVFLRKLALVLHGNNQYRCSDGEANESATGDVTSKDYRPTTTGPEMESSPSDIASRKDEKAKAEQARRKAFGMFLQLSVLSDIRKQLCAVAAVECEEPKDQPVVVPGFECVPDDDVLDGGSISSNSPAAEVGGVEEAYEIASRIARPLLTWCRLLETGIVYEVAPCINEVAQTAAALPVELAASETAIELAPQDIGCAIHGGDAVIRRMIQPDSGVEFRTLRVGEGSDSAMIVLFSKNAAMNWLISSGTEKNEEEALSRLERMERRRVIEPIAMEDLAIKAFTSNVDSKEEQDQIRYRFVDPWEVEGLESREAETMAASLGREHYYEFNVGTVADSCEGVFRKMGGVRLLGLWTFVKGGLRLTKAIASVYAPWERDAGGDLKMTDGVVSEPSSFLNSIREHLYRNALFRLLKLPQRFLSLVQVELLDLKNLTSPGGSASLTVFALLRLKREGSSARLTHKAKTLDTATTPPTKIGKTSGPNAAASWGSVVRFRFPLPEDVNCDGVSSDSDREALFKGPPSILQVSVYEKKFMSDIFLGSADIDLDALTGGGQLEEWVPLRASKQGIHWFARIRLTLRFELMCLGSDQPSDTERELPPSVGLQKIKQLSEKGGAVEDIKVKKSASTSDLLSYFESMVA